MLTVVEEFLLLTIKDEGGSFVDMAPEVQDAGFAGAAIMELALRERIDSDLHAVRITNKTPTGEKAVDLILARMTEPGFDFAADKLIGQLVTSGEAVREAALDRLCERKILTKTEGRILWFLKTRRYPIVDGSEIREAKLRLLEILLGDELPSPHDVCLMSLADTCGIITQIVPKSEMKRAGERLAALGKMDLIGQNVKKYITIFQEEMAIAIAQHSHGL